MAYDRDTISKMTSEELFDNLGRLVEKLRAEVGQPISLFIHLDADIPSKPYVMLNLADCKYPHKAEVSGVNLYALENELKRRLDWQEKSKDEEQFFAGRNTLPAPAAEPEEDGSALHI